MSLAVRPADLADGADAAATGRLVEAYLRRTEQEKAAHGAGAGDPDGPLPEPYRSEVADPRAAYADAHVLLACDGADALGVAVLRRAGDELEIKRLWTDPSARGRGAGSALLDAAIAAADGPLRLSVWEWRDVPIALYRSRGFAEVEPWDPRPGLLCLRR